MKFKVEMLR